MSMRADTHALRFVTYLAPEMEKVYGEMAEYVGGALGLPASLAVGGHRYDAFESDQADFGFI